MRDFLVALVLSTAIAGCTGNRFEQPGPVAIDPTRQAEAQTLLARGEESLLAGDYTNADSDLTAALDIDPSLAKAHGYRGVARAKLGDSEGALADYTRALALDPDFYIAYYNRGRIHAQQENFQAAIDDFTAALEAKPDFARALSNRGFTRAELGDYDGAIADLDAASEIFREAGDSDNYHRIRNAIRYLLP